LKDQTAECEDCEHSPGRSIAFGQAVHVVASHTVKGRVRRQDRLPGVMTNLSLPPTVGCAVRRSATTYSTPNKLYDEYLRLCASRASAEELMQRSTRAPRTASLPSRRVDESPLFPLDAVAGNERTRDEACAVPANYSKRREARRVSVALGDDKPVTVRHCRLKTLVAEGRTARDLAPGLRGALASPPHPLTHETSAA
jgi:hypothetical protein